MSLVWPLYISGQCGDTKTLLWEGQENLQWSLHAVSLGPVAETQSFYLYETLVSSILIVSNREHFI